MRYMPILPIGMYDIFKNSHVRDCFILPQFWKERAYRDFYQSVTWDHVIIDNACYEDGSFMSMEDLIRIAKSLKTERCFIVAPEDLESGLNTATLTIEAANKFGTSGSMFDGTNRPKWEMMSILHVQPQEMKLQYRMMCDAGYESMPLGISIFSYRHGWDRASLAKFVGVRDNYLHAFGLDNLLEIYNLRATGFDSVDSSIVASAAVNNIDLMGDTWMIDRQYNKDHAQLPRVNLLETEFDAHVKLKTLRHIIKLRNFVSDGELI